MPYFNYYNPSMGYLFDESIMAGSKSEFKHKARLKMGGSIPRGHQLVEVPLEKVKGTPAPLPEEEKPSSDDWATYCKNSRDSFSEAFSKFITDFNTAVELSEGLKKDLRAQNLHNIEEINRLERFHESRVLRLQSLLSLSKVHDESDDVPKTIDGLGKLLYFALGFVVAGSLALIFHMGV